MSEQVKARLLLASRIAAGMAANKANMAMRDWETQIAQDAWRVAGRLLALAQAEG